MNLAQREYIVYYGFKRYSICLRIIICIVASITGFLLKYFTVKLMAASVIIILTVITLTCIEYILHKKYRQHMDEFLKEENGYIKEDKTNY